MKLELFLAAVSVAAHKKCKKSQAPAATPTPSSPSYPQYVDLKPVSSPTPVQKKPQVYPQKPATVAKPKPSQPPKSTPSNKPKPTPTQKPKATPQPTQKPTATPQPPKTYSGDQACLDKHNGIRQKLGLVPLRWDNGLASSAAGTSSYLAGLGYLKHTRAGENLASGIRSCAAAAQLWLDEKDLYNGEGIGQGDFHAYGHYTQMIYPSTRAVGCAGDKSKTYWTCHYDQSQIENVVLTKY
ncbi:CAP domain-containing protein [Gorgonomyces haynaldii]|nr:CAP domain-containing protein [Gorgonomyces haynaldii]